MCTYPNIAPRLSRLLLALVVLVTPARALSTGSSSSSTDSIPPTAAFSVDAQVNPDGYTSARVCGRCHVDIYETWKKSMHSFALSNPIFDTAYMQAIKKVGNQAKEFCLRCHAPMTMYNGDFDLREGVTREGVSCDFCHTVTAVHLERTEKPYDIESGIVKRGIIKKAGSPAHEVAYSELHGTSEFCAGCHNYVSPDGVPIMSTYDEWRAGPYAQEGVQCQDCHMALSEGSRVAREIKETGGEFHVHNLIRDTHQLSSALSLEIVDMQHHDDVLTVDVRIANVGSGHMVPTGIPSREIVLSVACEVDRRARTQERRYRKVMRDANGVELTTDFETLLHAAEIVSDTRLAPREERLERFTFKVDSSKHAKVTATARYLYSPMILDRARFDVEMAQVEQTVH